MSHIRQSTGSHYKTSKNKKASEKQMPENNAALHVGTMGDILPDSCQDKVVWHIVRGCAAPHSSYMSHHKPLPSFHERCCFPLTASGVHDERITHQGCMQASHSSCSQGNCVRFSSILSIRRCLDSHFGLSTAQLDTAS